MSKIIQDAGYRAVVVYEKKKGRIARLHEKDGYDMVSSKKNGEVRHIEVKATAKRSFLWRHFTEAEFRAAVSDRDFYLYLVTEADSNPKISVMRRDGLLRCYRGTTVLHVISFPSQKKKSAETKTRAKPRGKAAVSAKTKTLVKRTVESEKIGARTAKRSRRTSLLRRIH